MKRINAKESRVYIEKLVNATADHLIAKMGATHGIKGFHKRLLKAVLQVWFDFGLRLGLLVT